MNRADEVFSLFVDANPVVDVTRAVIDRPQAELILPRLEGSDMQTQDRPIQVIPPAKPPRRRGGLIPALAGFLIVVAGIAIGVLLFDGNSTGGDVAKVSDGVSSFEGIAGTYIRRGSGAPTYFLLQDDGTIHTSPFADQLVDDPVTVLETTFEGTTALLTTTDVFCDQPDQGAEYQIQVLANGNLQFEGIGEDRCELRPIVLLGHTPGEVTVEFEPVSDASDITAP